MSRKSIEWFNLAVLLAILIFVGVSSLRSARGESQETPDLSEDIEILIPFTTATFKIGIYIPLPPIFIGEGMSYKNAKILTYFFKLGQNTSRFYIRGIRIYVLAIIALIIFIIKLLKIPEPKTRK